MSIHDSYSYSPVPIYLRTPSFNASNVCLPCSVSREPFIPPSQEVGNYLTALSIAQTRTTPYNPAGNGQCERYNGFVWKSILLTLKSHRKPISEWETVIDEVLHASRTLLCTATNETPHERFFSFPRRSSLGAQLPTWLLTPGPVYLRRHVRTSKDSPLVDLVHLVHANPSYALVRFSTGREDTVSITDLSPATRQIVANEDLENGGDNEEDQANSSNQGENEREEGEPQQTSAMGDSEQRPDLRRSGRIKKPPALFD